MTNVRNCMIKSCRLNDKAGHCTSEEISLGKHPINGAMGCLSLETDHQWLREQLARRLHA